jgi:thiamine-phosphate pyrophosphorylase
LVHQLGFSLYLVTDRSALPATSLQDVVESCLAAGLKAVQLREKDMAVRDLLGLAHTLRDSTRRHGAKLLINDRADVALAVGADGVQRAGTSLPVSALRAISPSGFLIGASVHAVDEARAAESAGADFLLFGPVYDTPSKRQYGPPQGLAALGQVSSAVSLPVFGVGGVTPGRVAEVMRTGAAGVAVIGAILSAERPADAVKAFLDALGRA